MPVTVAIRPLLIVTVCGAGVVQSGMLAKLTVWFPGDRFVTVAPLACHTPLLSTCHLARAATTLVGEMVTCSEPNCCGGPGTTVSRKTVPLPPRAPLPVV